MDVVEGIEPGEPERPVIDIDFADFWPGFDKHDNFFYHLLAQRYDVRISDDPALLIYSRYGRSFREYDCLRMMVNWENRPWSFSECDFAITCDLVSHRDHHRFPYFAAATYPWEGAGCPDPQSALAGKEGFAGLVVSNPNGTTRNRLLALMNEYRTVASGGRFENNVGGPVDDKLAFLRKYKFSLAFENSSYPGYTTEKLIHGMRAETVPIYWGNPLVANDLNVDRFLSFHEFGSLDALMRRVIEVDQDDDEFCEMLARPWFPNGVRPDSARHDLLLDWIGDALTDDRTPVAQRSRQPSVVAVRIRDRWRARRRVRSRVS